jgi:ABC-type nitrate/sulfonate/bicarbonate transport system substrate-binding protein
MEAKHMKTFPHMLLPALLGAAITLSACAAPPTPAPVTVRLSWAHSAQFAGFYAADRNGDYAAEGLTVTFIEGGPETGPALEAVLNGEAQFGVSVPELLLLARAEGKAARAIAADYRRSPRVYIALASSGITRPEDFVGKTVAVGYGGQPLLDAIMGHAGVRPGQYNVTASTSGLEPLYSGQVDVRAAFLTNEVITARAAGYELNLIYPDDYGVHFYADMIFATDDLIAANPDLVERFLRATLKGWTYAVENPDAVGPLVQKYAPDADPGLEAAKMTASIPLVNTGEDFIGWMKPDIWAGMEMTLREQGVLTAPVDAAQVYTLEFLTKIYGK